MTGVEGPGGREIEFGGVRLGLGWIGDTVVIVRRFGPGRTETGVLP